MQRKIIQIVAISDDPREIIALCNDGTLWAISPREDDNWTKIKAEIPQEDLTE